MSKRTIFERIQAAFLAQDAWINDSAYQLAHRIRDGITGYSGLFERIYVRGPARFFLEITSEALLPALIIGLGTVAYALPEIKDEASLWTGNRKYSVIFEDKFGNEIGQRGILHDDTVGIDDIPEHVINAVLATEDSRFFSHFGIDIIGTFRALVTNVRASNIVQGGSTITQQLAKNLFLTPERTVRRKIHEAFLALWIEQRKSKKEILKLYLDSAYMGAGSFGIEAAAQTYFNRSVRDINLPQAAMLAGLFKAPTRYAPHRNLPVARARAAVVLDRMAKVGFATQGEVIAAKLNPAEIIRNSKTEGFSPDYFLDWAYVQTQNIVKGRAYALRVKTTIDPYIQQKADYVVLTELQKNSKSRNVDQAALVAVATDGAVRAMVGGRDYGASQFNRATDAKRQPGSAFKPIVYLTALREGYRPGDLVNDSPVKIGDWSPNNYNRRYRGYVTLNTALTHSINTIPVKLAEEIGRRNVIRTARKLGITSNLVPNRSLPLGTSEVSVLEMAGAYATFASGGREAKPYGIVQIRTQDGGQVIYDHDRDSKPPQQIISPSYIADLNGMLANVITRGTGRRAYLSYTDAAGKTGTTQSYRDAWFVGYTGEIATAVWFGNDDYRPTNRITGGSLPAQTWQRFMTAAFSKEQLQAPKVALLKTQPEADPYIGTGGAGYYDDEIEDNRRSMTLPFYRDYGSGYTNSRGGYRSYRVPGEADDDIYYRVRPRDPVRITGDLNDRTGSQVRYVRKKKDFSRRGARRRKMQRYNSNRHFNQRRAPWQ
ncbi:MAG: penicillin-binding protein [Hyphomicrobiales bacterium]|nr:MAG: penicillin-binding protein [Hyphomicrobiales bacterium]